MVKDGIVLGKRYAVLSKIGAGGMADVYKGRDQMLNRYVAIKVLKKQYKEDENFVRKFRSEAQAAAGLIHPNRNTDRLFMRKSSLSLYIFF